MINPFRAVAAALTRLSKPNSGGLSLRRTIAGVRVDETTALKLSTVWACVRVISESMGVLPWHVFQRDGDKRRPYDTHPAAWLLGSQANPETTAYAFREVIVACAAYMGNGYAEIERDTTGRPIWLWQIEPWRVRPDRDASRRLVYRVKNDDGGEVTIPAENMFHLRGPSMNGVIGMDILSYSSESIALGLAMEQFGAAFFGNASTPSGVFENDMNLGPQQIEDFRKQYEDAQSGIRRAHKTMVLPKGMHWKQITIDPEKSQLTDSRMQQIEDVARRFRVPPHKIGHLLRSTFSNIEHQSIEFVTDCLLPWSVRLEQEANLKLFGRAQYGIAYTKLNLRGLLRGDSKSEADAFAVGRQWGWYSANDVRRLLDLDPIGEEGDIYLSPSNMMSASRELEMTDEPPQQTDPFAPDPTEDPTEDPSTEDGPQMRLIRSNRNGGRQ